MKEIASIENTALTPVVAGLAESPTAGGRFAGRTDSREHRRDVDVRHPDPASPSGIWRRILLSTPGKNIGGRAG